MLFTYLIWLKSPIIPSIICARAAENFEFIKDNRKRTRQVENRAKWCNLQNVYVLQWTSTRADDDDEQTIGVNILEAVGDLY